MGGDDILFSTVLLCLLLTGEVKLVPPLLVFISSLVRVGRDVYFATVKSIDLLMGRNLPTVQPSAMTTTCDVDSVIRHARIPGNYFSLSA